MKQTKVTPKLSLNKRTIAILKKSEMARQKGGVTYTYHIATCPDACSKPGVGC